MRSSTGICQNLLPTPFMVNGRRIPPLPRRLELEHGDVFGDVLECDFEGHVQHEGLGGLVHSREVGHHAGAFVQFHYGNGVGRFFLKSRRRPVADDIAVERTLAA